MPSDGSHDAAHSETASSSMTGEIPLVNIPNKRPARAWVRHWWVQISSLALFAAIVSSGIFIPLSGVGHPPRWTIALVMGLSAGLPLFGVLALWKGVWANVAKLVVWLLSVAAVFLWWPDPAPAAPAEFRVKLSDDRRVVTFEWPQSVDNSRIKEYELGCDDQPGLHVSKEPRYVTDTLSGGPHVCTLVAVGDNGYISDQRTAEFTLNEIDLSLFPPVLSVESVKADAVTLSWSFGPDRKPDSTKKIAIYRGEERLGDVDISAGIYTITGLAPATVYVYAVRVWDSSRFRESPKSNVVVVRTLDTTPQPSPSLSPDGPSSPVGNQPRPPGSPLLAPTGLSVTARTSTSISLAWDYAGGVTYELSDHGAAATSAQPSFASTGLSPATQYQYQVRAVDSAGRRSPYVSIMASTTGPDPHMSGHVWMKPNTVHHLDQDQSQSSTDYDIAYAPDGSAFQAAYGAEYAPVPAGGAAWDYRTCRNATGWKPTLAPAEFAPGQRVCVKTSLRRYGMLEFQTGPDSAVDVIFKIWREVPPDQTW